MRTALLALLLASGLAAGGCLTPEAVQGAGQNVTNAGKALDSAPAKAAPALVGAVAGPAAGAAAEVARIGLREICEGAGALITLLGGIWAARKKLQADKAEAVNGVLSRAGDTVPGYGAAVSSELAESDLTGDELREIHAAAKTGKI